MTVHPVPIGAPERRRATTADLLIVAAVVLWFISTWVFSALLGFLLRHPLVHLLLTGSISAQVTGGAYARDGTMPLAEVVVAAVIGCAMFDPLFYLVGRRYGDVLARTFVRSRLIGPRSVERGERLVERFGSWAVLLSWYLPVPNLLIYAAVGSAGMSFPVFLVLDVLAALLWCGLIVGLGYAVGDPALSVADHLTHGSWWVFGVTTVLTVSILAWRHRDRLPRSRGAVTRLRGWAPAGRRACRTAPSATGSRRR